MPFLKHNDPSVQVADANDTSHKCLWVALPNAELNKQLYTCTHAFAEWTGVDPGLGFKYRDMAAWAAEVAGIAADLDRRSYIQWYFGMQDSPGGLEEAFLAAKSGIEHDLDCWRSVELDRLRFLGKVRFRPAPSKRIGTVSGDQQACSGL